MQPCLDGLCERTDVVSARPLYYNVRALTDCKDMECISLVLRYTLRISNSKYAGQGQVRVDLHGASGYNASHFMAAGGPAGFVLVSTSTVSRGVNRRELCW
jgi:hypothetical protein